MREYENVIVQPRLTKTGQHCKSNPYASFLKAVLLSAIAFLLTGTIPEGAFAQSKKIIFPAGPKDHGVPGRHEYEKDLRVPAQSHENASLF